MCAHNNAPRLIVRHDDHEWQILPRRTFDIANRESGRAIAGQQNDSLIWESHPSRHRARNAEPDHAACPAGGIPAQIPIAEELMEPLPDVAAVNDEDDAFSDHRL